MNIEYVQVNGIPNGYVIDRIDFCHRGEWYMHPKFGPVISENASENAVIVLREMSVSQELQLSNDLSDAA